MFKLPILDYGYDSMSRSISEGVMKLHHDKHHQAYIDKLNIIVDANPILQGRDIDDLLSNIDSLPEPVRLGVRNMGGAHYNHSFFWKSISPDGGGEPSGDLAELLKTKYGSFQKFVDEFTAKSVSLFGSGWAWLLSNGDIITTLNQDTPISIGASSPLLCLDVWEHAYYLDYKNRRDEYVKSWWGIVDWESASNRYTNLHNKP